MKSIYFLILCFLISCSELDYIENNKEYSIEFSTETNKSTRSEINSITDLSNEGGFDVYGYKLSKYSSEWCTLFNKTNIVYNDGKWTYSPVYYWDNSCNYIFYGVAPHSENTSIIYMDGKIERYADNYPKDKLSIRVGNVKSCKVSEGKDYLIVRNPVVRINHTNEPVTLDFYHILSKIVIKFKAGIDDCKIKVTSLKFKGWLNEKFDFKQDINYSGNSISEWYIDENIMHYNRAGEGNFNLEDKEFARNIEGLPTEIEVKDHWLMIPQKIGAKWLKFTIDYTITYSDGVTDTFKNVEGAVDYEHYWYTDSQITYTLIISPEPIKFDVTSCTRYGSHSSTVVIK